jgi:tetratricopeptide (TPR) repeat protein
MSDSASRECASLEDVALIRALTVDKPQYDALYLAAAEAEMANRGLNLAEEINEVQIAHNEGVGETMTIPQAMAWMDMEWVLWSLLTVSNCIGDAWVIQKEYRYWLVHFYEGESYRFSFFYETSAQIKDKLKLFLSLEPWEVEDSHELSSWKPIFQTQSPAFLTKVVADLDREDVLHTVKTPVFTHDKKGGYVVTVPRYHLKDGERLIENAQQELAKLYDQAEHLAKGDDRDQELKIYDLLTQLVPDNPAVHYNRGQVLIEKDMLEEAIPALGEAIRLGLPEIPEQIRPGAKPGGVSRMVGSVNPLMSLVVLAGQSGRPKDAPIEYPDYLDDSALLLGSILENKSDSVAARHCLAAIAELKNDVLAAKKYYGDILKLDPQDEAAKANLRYHEVGET